jgi:hypothetical protein
LKNLIGFYQTSKTDMGELKHFEIVACPDGSYRFFIFATSGTNPLSGISEIEKQLAKRDGPCSVLFDLLLSNGETSNRYISAFFDGTRFNPESFKTVQSLPKEFKKIASEFYARNRTKVQMLLGKNFNKWI